MKALKIALLAVIGIVCLLVVAVMVLSLPGVQQAVVKHAATGPGDSMEMEHLRIGFNRTVIRDLHFRQPDASYRVAEMTADLSLPGLLFRRELRLGNIIATGIKIDLSDFEPTDDPEPFEGILKQMELPMPIYLETIRADGEVILPRTGNGQMRADFVVTGGGFAPGREGELSLNGYLGAPDSGPFTTLAVEGDIGVLQARGGRIERARLMALISASGMASQQEETLSADVLLLATDDGESYQVRFDRIVARETEETPDLSTLVVIDATYLHAEGLVEGIWEIDVGREQLAAFLADFELPVFSANGNGRFSYGITREIFEADGELDVAVEDPGQVVDQLRDLGGFTLNSRFNVAMDETFFRLDELIVELRDETGRNLLEARNHRPIRYDRAAEGLEGSGELFELAHVTIHALPVEWANLFIEDGENGLGLSINGGDLTGQLLVSAEDGVVFFTLTEPLKAEEVSLAADGEPMLADLSIEARGSGSFGNGRMFFALDPLNIFHAQTPVITATGEFDSATGELQANLEADLPLLFQQPVLAEYGNLNGGDLQMELLLRLNEPKELEANGSIRRLNSPDQRERLPGIVFQSMLRETAENVWEIDLPIRLEERRSSDLRLDGQFAMDEEVNRFELLLSGQSVILDQVTRIADAFGTAGNDRPVPNERDEEPFWAGWEGRLDLDVAELILHEENGVEGLLGELVVATDSVAHSLRGTYLDSALELDLSMEFDARQARPYVLTGIAEAPRMAVGDIFRQLQPDRPPTVEGIFALSADFEATGRNLSDLIDRIRFQVRLQSGGGIVRLFYTENPLAGLGFAATALLGRLGGDIGAIGQIAGRLSHMPYDEMRILAERDEELNYVLRDLTVLSPELHLRGRGEVRHRENVKILHQPMEINLTLGARGQLERSLAAIRVLGERRDELDYRQMRRDFTITGTPSNPDPTPFYRLLVDTVLRFVAPEDNDEEERRGLIPEIPEVFDFLRGIRGR